MSWTPPVPNPGVDGLQFATQFGPRLRPGIMTAVGVISIIVGSLSILSCLYTLLMSVVFIFMSQMVIPVMTPTTMPARTNGAVRNGTWATTAPAPGANAQITSVHFKNDTGASILMIGEAVVSLCVAVLLIFAGAMLLRNSPASLRLHRIYLIFKIPLIAIAAVAIWWTASGLLNNMMNSMNNNGAPPMPAIGSWMGIFYAVLYSAFALIYPVALLIVLSTRTSREYFKQISTDAVR